jgi:tetratricopeptide (TPR) repeat protein
MNVRLQRAMLLIQQGRHTQAEEELRQSLVQQPNDAQSHAALALCLVERQQFAEASQEAGTAIHLDPENPFVFYVQALVFRKRNRPREAETAIRQAIELAPYDADYHAMAAVLHLDERRWQAALDSAEEGLAFDPENVDCNNLRARALGQLGRPNDAQQVIADSLSRNPENSTTHALLGWTMIEKREYQAAMEHFREALRLEPESELARAGIVEALRAKRVLYRPILMYFLWIDKFRSRGQWAIVIGMYLVVNVLRRVANSNPALEPWVTPIIIAYTIFAISTWMAVPLFNLTLLLDPFGRLALRRREKITAAWIGACVLGALACVIIYFVWGTYGSLPAAVVFGLLIPPLSQINNCQPGWPRASMITITVFLAVLGFSGAAAMWLSGHGESRPDKLLNGLGILAVTGFLIGAVASQFIANWLGRVQPRR